LLLFSREKLRKQLSLLANRAKHASAKRLIVTDAPSYIAFGDVWQRVTMIVTDPRIFYAGHCKRRDNNPNKSYGQSIASRKLNVAKQHKKGYEGWKKNMTEVLLCFCRDTTLCFAKQVSMRSKG